MKKIVKYDNRKLYDKEKHGYINLDSIIKFIKDDIEFRITDFKGRDITSKTIISALSTEIIEIKDLKTFVNSLGVDNENNVKTINNS